MDTPKEILEIIKSIPVPESKSNYTYVKRGKYRVAEHRAVWEETDIWRGVIKARNPYRCS